MLRRIIISVLAALALCGTGLYAQTGHGDARRGNRQFAREKWAEADISYRKALVKDSLSFANNYNLADNLYRQGATEEAAKYMDKAIELSEGQERDGDAYFNRGDFAMSAKDWQTAVDMLKKAMLADPGDLEAKENYTYAKKMLENSQNNGGGQNQNNQDQNQDQNQNQQNQDQNNDQNKDQNQDQNKDQNNQNNGQNNRDQNQNQNNDQNRDNQGQNGQNPDGQDSEGSGDPQISPRQARQVLDAVAAKEKETRDKVEKEKAALLKARRLDKNW